MRLYVQSLQYTGTAEVLKEKRGDRWLIESPTGRTYSVKKSACRPMSSPPSPSLPKLELVPNAGRTEGAAVPKDPPYRSLAYLTWVRAHPCAKCGVAGPSEASHHPREGHGATGMKTSDMRTIALCARCHRTGPRAHHRKPFDRAWVEEQITLLLLEWAATV